MKTKLCHKCNTKKSLKDDFYPDASKKDGVKTPCKECTKTQINTRYRTDSVYRAEQRARRTERTKRIRRELSTFILKYLKEHGCVDCSEHDPLVLEFDHVRGKTMGISIMVRKCCTLDAIKKEIAKCEVRCANCHRRKTAKERNYYADIDLTTL